MTSSSETTGQTDAILREILCDVLGLDRSRVDGFTADTGLFGHLPELDSMAVAGLLTEIEDRLDIVIDDDEVDGEMLENFGALLAFAQAKREDG
ncbi:MAG TPA: acyl carrier protein [Sphingomonadaceae bacterium]|nr:acyl carrier protein [Sphingomonadaceae bacterium]